MANTIAELLQLVSDKVLTGGRRTTAVNLKDVYNPLINSTLNIKDGGLVVESETGYTTEITLTDDKAFTNKKYVDDLVGSITGGLNYLGVWNASTNIPALSSGVGNSGDYYIVDVAGSTNLDGISDWNIGDWVIFSTVWQKIDNSEELQNLQSVLNQGNVSTTTIETTGFIKTGGISSEFLKADGSVDSSNYLEENTAIIGATKTKITYDAKGLVISGTDATTADINDSLNKRYVTDSQLTVIGNQSNTNTGDETQTTIETKLGFASVTASTIAFFNATKKLISGTGANLGTFFQTLTAKSTPTDADTIIVNDSATSFEAKKTTLTQFKAFLKTYFDTIYGSAFSGTVGTFPKFTSSNAIGNSRLKETTEDLEFTNTTSSTIFKIETTATSENARVQAIKSTNIGQIVASDTAVDLFLAQGRATSVITRIITPQYTQNNDSSGVVKNINGSLYYQVICPSHSAFGENGNAHSMFASVGQDFRSPKAFMFGNDRFSSNYKAVFRIDIENHRVILYDNTVINPVEKIRFDANAQNNIQLTTGAKLGNNTDTPIVSGGGTILWNGKSFDIGDGVGGTVEYYNTLIARKYTAYSFTTSTVITTTAIVLNSFAVAAKGVNDISLSTLRGGSVIKFKYLGVVSANIGNGTRTINIKLGTVQVLTLSATGADSNFSLGNVLTIEGEIILDTASSTKGNLSVNFGSTKSNYVMAATTATNIAAFTSGALNIELVNNNVETSTILGSTFNIEITK